MRDIGLEDHSTVRNCLRALDILELRFGLFSPLSPAYLESEGRIKKTIPQKYLLAMGRDALGKEHEANRAILNAGIQDE